MIPTQATLKQLPLHKILLTCYQTRQSGLLVLQDGERKKVLLLDKGNPRGCRSNIKQETLGFILMEQGLISEAKLREVLREKEESDGLLLGAALVNKGLVDPEKLMRVLEQQLLHRVYDLFTWQDAAIKLHPPGAKAAPEAIQLTHKTPSIVLRGLIFAAERNNLLAGIDENLIPTLLHSADVNAMKVDDLDLKGPEVAFVRSLHGAQTVGSLLASSRISKAEALGLIFGLEKIGLLTLQAQTAAAPAKPSEAPRTVSVTSGAPAAPAAAALPQGEFGRSVSERLRALADKDHFTVLGVSREADEAEIRKVYFRLAKEYHPDKLRAIADEKSRRDGETLFGKISEAYNTLIDANKRQTYMATLSIGTDDATAKATKILESEALFQRARNLTRQGEFIKSRAILEEAIALHADEPEYHIYLGWCLFKVGTAEKKADLISRGKQLIERFKTARKQLDAGFYFLGEIALAENNVALAEKMFNQVLAINPKSHEAERQLRLIDMRREKKGKEGGKGFMGGVFKKDR